MSHRPRAARAYLSFGSIAAVVAAALVALGATGGTAGAKTTRPTDLIKVSHQLTSTSPTIPAKMTCAQLAADPNFAGLQKFPTSIASGTVVPANSTTGSPEYCDIQGMIAPQTHFDLKLPTTTWQGRYLQNGCGGYCGTVSSQSFPSCDATLGGDFAMATDDEGHSSEAGLGGGGLFGLSQDLRVQYGYASEHALSVVSKTIIDAFYGQVPNYSYYDGCSDGGREAMEVAERYPTDFNGIIAGAPEIIAGPLNAEQQTWDYAVNVGPDGNTILTADKLPALHAAVIKACGGDDGANDGIITDPRSCHFDPASIQCPAGTNNSSCLTAPQVKVVDEYYSGPTDPQGRKLYPGGVPYGSELGWTQFQIPAATSNGVPVAGTKSLDYAGLSLPYLRYQLLAPGKVGPDPSQWQFTDQDFQSMFPAANTFDAMSYNLKAFRAHGGKLIIWQGWSDNGIPPTGTVDYYENLENFMGGQSSTQKFARLFLFPGEYHCAPGYTNSSFDLVYPMVQWVEGSSAPSQIVASDTVNGTALTRPVYPYPDIPKYNGSGDTNSAASFHPVPSPDAKQYTNWYGNYLFTAKPLSSTTSGWSGNHHSHRS
jgi:Tannase and feruloyl esterase